jgi:3-deoxy-D-manno-octulosonate 8-phosphate phosphatase (KDO 8-P phosphatase)
MLNKKPKCFILDVDGVMTTGHFLYTAEGKVIKIFGPDDNDGLSLLKNNLEVRFVTGDKKGFAISHKRIVDDMKFPLELVSTIRRVDWIRERYALEVVIYTMSCVKWVMRFLLLMGISWLRDMLIT